MREHIKYDIEQPLIVAMMVLDARMLCFPYTKCCTRGSVLRLPIDVTLHYRTWGFETLTDEHLPLHLPWPALECCSFALTSPEAQLVCFHSYRSASAPLR